jgi:hypothetical protein
VLTTACSNCKEDLLRSTPWSTPCRLLRRICLRIGERLWRPRRLRLVCLHSLLSLVSPKQSMGHLGSSGDPLRPVLLLFRGRPRNSPQRIHPRPREVFLEESLHPRRRCQSQASHRPQPAALPHPQRLRLWDRRGQYRLQQGLRSIACNGRPISSAGRTDDLFSLCREPQPQAAGTATIRRSR